MWMESASSRHRTVSSPNEAEESARITTSCGPSGVCTRHVPEISGSVAWDTSDPGNPRPNMKSNNNILVRMTQFYPLAETRAIGLPPRLGLSVAVWHEKAPDSSEALPNQLTQRWFLAEWVRLNTCPASRRQPVVLPARLPSARRPRTRWSGGDLPPMLRFAEQSGPLSWDR